jgi:predicted phage terminase large subunit-like protein
MAEDVTLDASHIDTFTRGLLATKYDNPKPIPPFHHEMWELCCSEEPYVAIAAPREHAKSTAITHAYILAMMCYKKKSFCLLVSDTETQAAEFLGDIKAELVGNDLLRENFGIKKILKDTETNIIVQFADGKKFRIVAKGSMQKVRGLKWNGRRPDLIVGDDLENDDLVMNPERRSKFQRWFLNALIPCGSDTCWVRIVGTIIHMDGMLQRLIDAPSWKHLFYEAHNPDFSVILWPEQWPKERLLRRRQTYIEQNNPEGYAQEYLNKPIAIENAFFNPDYFYDFDRDKDGHWIKPNLEYYAACDFAISEKERADYTAIVVVGMDPDGILHVVDAKRGRWDSESIIEELLATNKHYKPNMWIFETAKIDKAIGPYLEIEMRKARNYLNIHPETPTQSKTMRARSIQGMHKSGSIKYDKDAHWYPDFEGELLTVADSGPRGKHDDYFDAFAYCGLAIDMFYEAQSNQEIEDEEWEEEYELWHDHGRNKTTGY